MRNLTFLLILAAATACSSAKLNTLQAENEALRAELSKLREVNGQLKLEVKAAEANSIQAEANLYRALKEAKAASLESEKAIERALNAEKEAIKQKEAAVKALKDCKGK